MALKVNILPRKGVRLVDSTATGCFTTKLPSLSSRARVATCHAAGMGLIPG
jgi:hypothetical protein